MVDGEPRRVRSPRGRATSPSSAERRYRISAWVKAENVKGIAAWYIQVGTAEKPVLVAPPLAGGGGTYGWKEVSAEFTAPAEANLASLGTILHGTGTAWFDNVRLECLEPIRVKVLAEKPERRMLADAGAHAPWRDVSLAKGAADAAAAYDHRVAVRLFNGSQEAIRKSCSPSTPRWSPPARAAVWTSAWFWTTRADRCAPLI